MTTKQLALYALFLIIGIAIGGLVTNLAYKPLFVAQAIEIYHVEEEHRQLQEKFVISRVEMDALRQDMNEFFNRPTLLKYLGIVVE